MRGKVRNAVYGVFVFRITPAYAGKSFPVVLKGQLPEDHPRLCGEKVYPLPAALSHVGSPPPMRGKADDRSFCIVGSGITPAYAGKRLS